MAGPKKKARSDRDPPETALDRVAKAVQLAPEVPEAWNHLEELAESEERSSDVAAIYREVLAARPELAALLGKRAVDFHDNWGEEPSIVASLVASVFAAAPSQAWVVDRLKLTHAAEERWDDLLALFDTALAGTTDTSARLFLLDDAARVARDFARDVPRATRYVEEIYAARKDDKTRAALEKLYERADNHEALVTLYRERIPVAPKLEAQALRAKIAMALLSIDDHAGALSMVEEMLAVDADDATAIELLERIFATPARSIPPPKSQTIPPPAALEVATASTPRRRAALLLKPRYAAAGRSRDLVRVLEAELAGIRSDAERAVLYREIVGLELETLKNDAGALDALSALVALEPAETSHRRMLAEVAERLGKHDRRAKVLTNAAGRAGDRALEADLLIEAAEVQQGPLNAPGKAIDLYQRVLGQPGLEPTAALQVARVLASLLETAGRAGERCEVLELLSKLETDPDARRAALGEVARIASKDFGDADRAVRAWRTRLEDDAADPDAIQGLRETLRTSGRLRELAQVLEASAAARPELAESLLLEAGAICERDLDDAPAAIRCYEGSLAAGASEDVTERLAKLYRLEARRPELLALRRRQVETAPLEVRVRLRLEIVEVLEESGELEACVAELAKNLVDAPTDRATVEKLAVAFESTERWADLAALWEEQARLADEQNDPSAVAAWQRAAVIAEQKLNDLERAVRDYEWAPDDAASLDALARLYLVQDDPRAAAAALERLAARAEGDDAEILKRLVKAYVAAGKRDIARARLEKALSSREDVALADLLTELYRGDEAWSPLAMLLAKRAETAANDEERVAFLRAAAVIDLERRSDPAAAVPLLTRAVELAPSDLGLALLLGPALAAIGKTDDGIALLRERIAGFGARRPKERARVHHALGRVLYSSGAKADGVAELDLAVKIDPVNLETRRALADAAEGAGDLVVAQRTYRALLIVLAPSDGVAPPAVLRGELLLSMASIADRRGESEEAAEHLESALAAARENEWERSGVQRRLLADGRFTELAALLSERLDAGDPAQAAAACDHLADLYETRLDRVGDALAIRSRALTLTPRSTARHAALLATARKCDRPSDYLELCQSLAEREKSAEGRHELHALLGAAYEELGRQEDAARAYEQAERAAVDARDDDGVRLDAVWKSLDRVYVALGDGQARIPVLQRRAASEEARETSPRDRADTQYELGSVWVADAATLDIGLEAVTRAMALDPQIERATAAVQRALETAPRHEGALRLYETLSEGPGRELARIDVLQRIGELPGKRSVLCEAATLAQTLGARDRAESLLRRYLAIGESLPLPPRKSGVADPEHAAVLLALAGLRLEAGDVAGSVTLKESACDFLVSTQARAVRLDIARLFAGPLGDPSKARKLYTSLHYEAPTDRLAWEPLADLYRAANDGNALATLIEEAIPSVETAAERIRLRLEQARVLSAAPRMPSLPPPPALDDDDGWSISPSSSQGPPTVALPHSLGARRPSLMPPASGKAAPSAARALWAVLEDDPSNDEATTALTSLLERTGRQDELARLLRKRIDAEIARGDKIAAAALSTRLGRAFASNARDEEAIAAYKASTGWNPTDAVAHRALMELGEKRQGPAELATTIEAVLSMEHGAEAERLALKLASIRSSLGTPEAEASALELGLARAPESAVLRERLIDTYESAGAWKKLAAFYERSAETREAVGLRVIELRLAAKLRQENLDDTAGAVALLEKAWSAAPHDHAILLDLVSAWRELGETSRMKAALDEEISRAPDPILLTARAHFSDSQGRLDDALADLERAYELAPEASAEDLAGLLGRKVQEGGDAAPHARLRHAQILAALERREEACVELETLIHDDPRHREALTMLAEERARDGRTDEALDAYRRLLMLEEGEPLARATLAFAELCERHGRLDVLIPALERAREVAPGHAEISMRLAATYLVTDEKRKLASLYLEEADRATDPIEQFDRLAEAARLLVDPERGDPNRAMEVLARARTIREGDPEIGLLLADAYTASNRSPEALEVLEELLSVQKRRSKWRAAMHKRVGYIYNERGAQMIAIESYLKALDDDPHDAEFAIEVGELAVEINDLEATAKAFRTITLMKTVPEGSTDGATSAMKGLAYYHLARVAMRQGEPRKARVFVDKAIAESPTDDARELLEQLKKK